MVYASDFRRIARESLRGRWGKAVLAGLIATLLGVSTNTGLNLNFQVTENGASGHIGLGTSGIPLDQIFGLALPLILAALVLAVVLYCLGWIISLGYNRFHLDLVEGQVEPQLETLFAYFPHWRNAVGTGLLQGLYIFLWSLLFVIPGIVASYSYAMTSFILAEHPELSPQESLARSKAMMRGNRWRLFCLHFSFIGWSLLSALTMGIGNLWLNPYRQSAVTAFYRELTGGNTTL